MIQPTEYRIHSGKLPRTLCFAVASDLHNAPFGNILPLLRKADALLIPGDLINRYTQQWDRGIAFLRAAAERLPVFLSPGNHDLSAHDLPKLRRDIADTGVTFLANEYARFEGVVIGGWYSPVEIGHLRPFPMKSYAGEEGFRLMLAHKPNWFAPFLKNEPIDLVLSGHAHGGQIRIANQGLYAPGQGLLPILTKGFYYNNRLLVTSGWGNPCSVPRWGNPPEILHLYID